MKLDSTQQQDSFLKYDFLSQEISAKVCSTTIVIMIVFLGIVVTVDVMVVAARERLRRKAVCALGIF